MVYIPRAFAHLTSTGVPEVSVNEINKDMSASFNQGNEYTLPIFSAKFEMSGCSWYGGTSTGFVGADVIGRRLQLSSYNSELCVSHTCTALQYLDVARAECEC